MADRIQIRRDTAANWTSANPTLAQGEMAIETDTLKLKLGDGSTAWVSLAYYSPPITVATIGSSPNAQGASTSGSTLTLQPASASFGGLVTTGTQSFAGAKTFTGAISASNLSGTNTGDQTITLTSDITGSGTGSFATTLATVNSNVGTFGTATQVSTFTVNGKGLITAASNTSIQIAESQVTNLVSDLASKQTTTLTSANILVGNGSNVATSVAVSGDLTLVNTGAFTVAKIQGTVVSGTTGATNVAFSASPTFSGTVTTANLSANASAAATVILGGSSSTANQTINGGIVLTTRSTASNFTVDTTTNDCIIFIDVSGAAKTITLPTPTNGRVLYIKDSTGNAETNNITLAQHSSEKIEGVAASKILSTNWGSWILTSNGTDWFFL